MNIPQNKFILIFILTLSLTSCATIDGMISSEDEATSEIRDVSLDQRLQISIPIPDNSQYATDKTVIFGEGNRFTGVLYLIHDESAEDVVDFYRKAMISEGWTELAIVRSNFILLNFDKEDRFATIKVSRKVFNNSESEITIGPKTSATINRSINIQPEIQESIEEPFEIQ